MMKGLKHLMILGLLMNLYSCGQLTSRSYLSEMDQEDAGFYSPGDFPIMAGDTGRTFETQEERRRRTPSSEADIQHSRTRDFLKHELRTLESRQSDEAMKEYQQYKPKLKTESERIYFLKLSDNDRQDYLESRGWLKARVPYDLEEHYGLRPEVVTMGMSKAEVMKVFGKPSRVEIAGNPSFENERWLYSVNGASKYVYFESGRVEGWE
jgi:hypothetical protein